MGKDLIEFDIETVRVNRCQSFNNLSDDVLARRPSWVLESLEGGLIVGKIYYMAPIGFRSDIKSHQDT